MNKQPRVYWEDHEKEFLIQGVANAIRKNPSLGLIEACNRIQAQMPENRRRNVCAVSAVPWLRDGVSKILQQDKELSSKPQVVEKLITTSLSDFSLEDLLRETVKRCLAPVIKGLITEEINAAVMSAMGRYMNPQNISAKQEEKKKRILVIGLMPDQQNQISGDFGSKFDMKFFKDENIHILKPMATNSDVVILMTKFISHVHQEAVRQCKPYFVNGGVSDLKNFLKNNV